MVALDCYGFAKGVVYVSVFAFSIAIFGVIDAQLLDRARDRCAYYGTGATCEFAMAVGIISFVMLLLLIALYALDLFERLPDFLGAVSLGVVDLSVNALLLVLWLVASITLTASREMPDFSRCSPSDGDEKCSEAHAILGLSWTNVGLLVASTALVALAFRQKK